MGQPVIIGTPGALPAQTHGRGVIVAQRAPLVTIAAIVAHDRHRARRQMRAIAGTQAVPPLQRLCAAQVIGITAKFAPRSPPHLPKTKTRHRLAQRVFRSGEAGNTSPPPIGDSLQTRVWPARRVANLLQWHMLRIASTARGVSRRPLLRGWPA